MKQMKSWGILLLFVLCSGCVTTESQFNTYSSRAKLPSSYSSGNAMIGIGLEPAESAEAFSIRGDQLLYKPTEGGVWKTAQIEEVSTVQVRRSTKSNRILSGAFIGSSLGLGLGFAASKFLNADDGDLSQTTSAGLYPSAGAFTGMLLGIGSTSIGDAPWDTYIPKQEDGGSWRFVLQELEELEALEESEAE